LQKSIVDSLVKTRLIGFAGLLSGLLLIATTFFFATASNDLPAAAATNPEQLIDACWQETFKEEFDELRLWNPETRTGDWKTSYIWGSDIRINNELQYYIDPAQHGYSPFSLNDSILTITARPTPPDLRSKINNMPYISGALTTEEGFSQKYGRFEVRAKVPRGKGLWSAFWLLPSFESWPEGVAILPEILLKRSVGTSTHQKLLSTQHPKISLDPSTFYLIWLSAAPGQVIQTALLTFRRNTKSITSEHGNLPKRAIHRVKRPS